jgi:hypothetical protein
MPGRTPWASPADHRLPRRLHLVEHGCQHWPRGHRQKNQSRPLEARNHAVYSPSPEKTASASPARAQITSRARPLASPDQAAASLSGRGYDSSVSAARQRRRAGIQSSRFGNPAPIISLTVRSAANTNETPCAHHQPNHFTRRYNTPVIAGPTPSRGKASLLNQGDAGIVAASTHRCSQRQRKRHRLLLGAGRDISHGCQWGC